VSFVIAVVGDSMLDHYIYGDITRLSPEAPVPVVKTNCSHYSPGGAAHVAASIQALNQPAVLFTAVGPDDEGKKLLFGLGTLNVTCNSTDMLEWSTPVKTRIMANGNQILRYDREYPIGNSPSYASLSVNISTKLKAIARELKSIVISDYNKKTISKELKAAIQVLREKNPNITLFVDAKPETLSQWPMADCITPNFIEAIKFLGLSDSISADSAKNDKLCENLAKNLSEAIPGLSLAVITRAQHGCSWYDKGSDTYGSLPAFNTCKADVIGAGDTFIAALAVAFGENKTIPEAISFANAASALAVAKPGTAVVHRMELDSYLVGPKNDSSISKIMSQSAAIDWARQLRATNEKVVFANGCFDLLHTGHVHLLEQAKFAGGYLLVGLNDDQSIKDMKGSDRPIIDMASRARMLAALGCVDGVVTFCQADLEPLIEAVRPDILVKGSEYAGKKIPGSDVVEKFGGQVLLVDMHKNAATTRIISEIQQKAPTRL